MSSSYSLKALSMLIVPYFFPYLLVAGMKAHVCVDLFTQNEVDREVIL